jgi:hypothetical protein
MPSVVLEAVELVLGAEVKTFFIYSASLPCMHTKHMLDKNKKEKYLTFVRPKTLVGNIISG